MHTKKLSELVTLGFQGVDKSLAISLDEYGLAWAENPEYPLDWHFCFKQSNGNFVLGFYFRKDLDIKKEFNWVNWKAFISFLGDGTSFKQWNKSDVPHKIFDLISYYGTLEIMGDSYQEGWQIDWEN